MNRESYLEHYSCNDNWLRILEGEKLAQATRLNRAICGLFTSHESEIRKLNKEIFELQQLTKEQLIKIINNYPRNGVSESYKDNAVKVLNDLND